MGQELARLNLPTEVHRIQKNDQSLTHIKVIKMASISFKLLKRASTSFKILNVNEWNDFQQTGEFFGTLLDLKDGYIHMSSTKEQMERVKNKYYKDTQIYLLTIDLTKLDAVKFEPISNGDIYPHQYGILKLTDVISAHLM